MREVPRRPTANTLYAALFIVLTTALMWAALIYAAMALVHALT